MVAYGVLELKPKKAIQSWLDEGDREAEHKEDFERDQLRKMVNDELRRYGLLLARMIVPKNQGWRTKQNAHILYGQVQGRTSGFPVRAILAEGDFRECCIKAAEVLDEMNNAQELGT